MRLNHVNAMPLVLTKMRINDWNLKEPSRRFFDVAIQTPLTTQARLLNRVPYNNLLTPSSLRPNFHISVITSGVLVSLLFRIFKRVQHSSRDFPRTTSLFIPRSSLEFRVEGETRFGVQVDAHKNNERIKGERATWKYGTEMVNIREDTNKLFCTLRANISIDRILRWVYCDERSD